jgi:hypothetical protein
MFMIIMAGFLYLLFMVYMGALAIMPPTHSSQNIYYAVNMGLCSRII